MTDVVAEGLVIAGEAYREKAEIKNCGCITVPALHNGYVFDAQREDMVNPTGAALLQCRADHLVDYVLAAQGADVVSRFRAAFQRMDDELKKIVEGSGCETFTVAKFVLWTTRHNSVVVLVNHETNKVAACIAALSGEDWFEDGDKILQFYKEAKIKSVDDYLIIASLMLVLLLEHLNSSR